MVQRKCITWAAVNNRLDLNETHKKNERKLNIEVMPNKSCSYKRCMNFSFDLFIPNSCSSLECSEGQHAQSKLLKVCSLSVAFLSIGYAMRNLNQIYVQLYTECVLVGVFFVEISLSSDFL